MSATPRPPAVSTACLFIGLSSLLLLFNAISWLSSWNSMEIQDALRSGLDDAGIADAGMSVDTAITWLRRAVLALVAVLIAGVVFAVYAFRGHRPSRIYLTVMCGVAALLFVTFGGLIGLLPGAFAVFSGIQLWSAEAGRWFDVKNGITPKSQTVAARPADPHAPQAWVEPPHDPFAPQQPHDGQQPYPPQPYHPYGQPPPGWVQPAVDPDRRPAAVQTAALTTMIGAWVVVIAGAFFLAAYLISPDAIVRSQADTPMPDSLRVTDDELRQSLDILAVLCAVVVPLAIVALGAVLAMYRRIALGRIVTLVLAWITIPVAVFTLIGIPWGVAAIVVILQLRKPEARQWFVRT